jgi:hypothetical protein
VVGWPRLFMNSAASLFQGEAQRGVKRGLNAALTECPPGFFFFTSVVMYACNVCA